MVRRSPCVFLGGVQIALPLLESVVGMLVKLAYLKRDVSEVPASWAG